MQIINCLKNPLIYLQPRKPDADSGMKAYTALGFSGRQIFVWQIIETNRSDPDPN